MRHPLSGPTKDCISKAACIIKSDFTRFVFPPRWHYDILRALDYFQAVDAPRDPRLSEAIDIVRSRRRQWSISA